MTEGSRASGADRTEPRTASTEFPVGTAAPPRHPGLSPVASRPRHRWLSSLINAGWAWASKHGAIGPGDRPASRFGAFGSGSCIAFPPGAVFGERWIRIGRDTLIGPHTSISAGMVPGQTMVTDPVVSIGDRCMIGRGSHIVGHLQVVIGDDVHTGPYVYITDQNHGYEDPDQVVHVQWPSDVPVEIGSGSWIGTGVVILPGAVLGKNVVVGAGAVVKGTFPDHCVIAGVPAKVVRRYVPGVGWVGASGSSVATEATSGTDCGSDATSGGAGGVATGADGVPDALLRRLPFERMPFEREDRAGSDVGTGGGAGGPGGAAGAGGAGGGAGAGGAGGEGGAAGVMPSGAPTAPSP